MRYYIPCPNCASENLTRKLEKDDATRRIQTLAKTVGIQMGIDLRQHRVIEYPRCAEEIEEPFYSCNRCGTDFIISAYLIERSAEKKEEKNIRAAEDMDMN